MSQPARLAPAINNKRWAIQRPFSNFAWIQAHFAGEQYPIQRILAQIRVHEAGTLFMEEIRPEEATDLREENEDIRQRHAGAAVPSRAWRLSFLRPELSDAADLRGLPAEDILGYAIVKRDGTGGNEVCRVYESVVRINHHRHNYLRGRKPWQFQVAGHSLAVEGHLYAQQNGWTNSCAHVALRTAAASFHRDGDMSYREMNAILGFDHVKRCIGQQKKSCEVTIKKMVDVLRAAGADCDVADYEKPPRMPLAEYDERMHILQAWQKYAYGSVESGYPAIVVFGIAARRTGHAIPVFGHTFNQDTWVPSAEQHYFNGSQNEVPTNEQPLRYISSDAWLSSFICHDDNIGSNLCVPRHYLRIPPAGGRKQGQLPNLGADFLTGVIATRPPRVQFSAYRAEYLTTFLFPKILAQMPVAAGNQNPWLKRLREAKTAGRLIFRTLLCSGLQYADHLKKVRDWHGRVLPRTELTAIATELGPDLYWMVEISMPDVFAINRRKLAEIVFRTDASFSVEPNSGLFKLARGPEFFARLPRGGNQTDFDYKPSALGDHIELYDCEEPGGGHYT